MVYHPSPYRKAYARYLRRGTALDLSLKASAHSTPSYIWRTRGDDKVRTSHAENNGRIFSWNNPPATGHPSEDYNCRCTAEPYVQGESEFANQTLWSLMHDNPKNGPISILDLIFIMEMVLRLPYLKQAILSA